MLLLLPTCNIQLTFKTKFVIRKYPFSFSLGRGGGGSRILEREGFNCVPNPATGSKRAKLELVAEISQNQGCGVGVPMRSPSFGPQSESESLI